MATTQNIVITQGSTFSQTFDLDVDITNHITTAVIYPEYGATGKFMTFETTTGDAGGGSLTLGLSATATAELLANQNRYEIETISGAVVAKYFEGFAVVNPQLSV
jgi:hypothetical protein